MDVRKKLEVITHLGDHITYKEDIGICYDSLLAKVIEDAYMELKNGVTVQEWISVNDRLPENICPVLVALEGLSAAFNGWYHDRKWWTVGAGTRPFTQKVTHWMPLPQPPKGE